MSRLLAEMLNEVHAKEKQAVEEAFKSNQMELNKEGYYQLKEGLAVRSNGTAFW